MNTNDARQNICVGVTNDSVLCDVVNDVWPLLQLTQACLRMDLCICGRWYDLGIVGRKHEDINVIWVWFSFGLLC